MTISIKKTVIGSLLLTSLALTACSDTNPLDTEPRSESLLFIHKASEQTEKLLHYTSYPPGAMYHDCMSGVAMSDPVIKKNPELCNKLFEGIVVYAKTTDGPYQNITVDDLKNDQIYRKIYQLPPKND